MANGTLKVSNIQTSSGSGTITIGQSGETVTIPSGVTMSGMGKVLQVVFNSYSTGTSTTSSTFVTTNLSASITPSSTSSKILVIFNINSISANATGTSAAISLFRDSTQIYSPEEYVVYNNSASSNYSNSGGNYLDSPASISSINYNLQFKRSLGAGTVEIHTNSKTSSITLMEIAG